MLVTNHAPKAPTPVPTSGPPDEVGQLFKDGTDSGVAVNGNDNAANALAIDQLDQALIGPTGLLTVLLPGNPMAVWANYQMVGGLWTKNGQASGAPPPVPSQHGPANAESPQRGSLELANVRWRPTSRPDLVRPQLFRLPQLHDRDSPDRQPHRDPVSAAARALTAH